jgi:hypothetical protein
MIKNISSYLYMHHVLNAWHPCAKNKNAWNNKICVSFKQTNEIGKFVMMISWKIGVVAQIILGIAP